MFLIRILAVVQYEKKSLFEIRHPRLNYRQHLGVTRVIVELATTRIISIEIIEATSQKVLLLAHHFCFLYLLAASVVELIHENDVSIWVSRALASERLFPGVGNLPTPETCEKNFH